MTICSEDRGSVRSLFRPDIQALRAVAVGLVLLNHLWPQRVPGGFIGVDVFFVISGFLITAHLRREVDSSGRVRLLAFWARRAKRLLPAAMVVLAFGVLVTAVWLPITNRQSAFDQIGAAGTYVLNWVLAAASLNYFAQGSASTPVTHYWSLSVEEQFYLVWPLLIVACVWLLRRRRGRDALMMSVFALTFVTSLAWAVHSASVEPSAAYFQTTGRAWEFAAGGLLTFLPARRAGSAVGWIPVAWLGWATLAFGAFSLNGSSGFPGWLALVPVLATGLLIWVGDIDHSWSPSKLTSFGPVQFVGGISYSLYLWHWPLIIAAPFVLHREIFARDKVVIAVVAVALAYLSRRFVEDPVRQSRLALMRRPGWVIAGTAATMALLLAVTIPSSAQLDAQAAAAARDVYNQSVNPGPCFGAQATNSNVSCPDNHVLTSSNLALGNWNNQIYRTSDWRNCEQPRGAVKVVSCSFGAHEGAQTLSVALVGDSHAGMWSPALTMIAASSGIRFTTFLESTCAVTADPTIVYKPDQTHADGCRAWREAVIAKVAADPRFDIVMTSSNDRNYSSITSGTSTTDSGAGYASAWKEWLAAGKRVVAINDAPQHPSLVPDCIARSATLNDPCTIPVTPFTSPSPLQLAAAHMNDPGFRFVDFQSVFCDSVCHSVIGGIPAYIDSDHLSAPFVRSLSFKLMPFLYPSSPASN